jgi:Iap family predicted aminopeptidase
MDTNTNFLDDDQKRLLELLSFKETFEDIKRIFDVGERAVGTPGEYKAVKIIESRFKEIGLENVNLEAFNVMTDYHENAEINLLKPIQKKIACGRCHGKNNLGLATDLEGITASIIDVGFGRLQDFRNLKDQGVNFEEKIVLIEVNYNLQFLGGAWAAVLQAQEFGASAAILTSVIFERDILRNYAIHNAAIPVVSIPYIDAQEIRRLLWEGEVNANLKNLVKVDVESKGYNVVGEILGQKYPEEIIILTAHHDSWYGAANDDISGVAVMMQVAKILIGNYRNARTIRFVTCGGEEGGLQPDEDDIYPYMVGSYVYTKKHLNELDKIIANINLDGFAYGLNSTISLTSELEPLTKKLINELDSEVLYEYWPGPSTGLDQWNFVREGVPSISINPNMNQYLKIYHSNVDTPELLNYGLVRIGLKLVLSLVLKLDSSTVLPYDFSSTSNKILGPISERLGKVDDTIGLKKLFEDTTHLKVTADNFKKKLDEREKELDIETIQLINKAQKKICTSLIPKLSDIKCGMSISSANTIPAYLDALINIKKSIIATKNGDKETSMTALKTLTGNLWSLDYSINIYEDWRKEVISSKRVPGLRFDIMPEARKISEKFKKGIEDKNREISSLEEKYNLISKQIAEKLTELDQAIIEASSILLDIVARIDDKKI